MASAPVLWMFVSNVAGLKDVDLEVDGMNGCYIKGYSKKVCGLVDVNSAIVCFNNSRASYISIRVS